MMLAEAVHSLRTRAVALVADEKRFHVALGVVTAIGLFLRLLHVFFVDRAFGDEQIFDAIFYHDEARTLLGLIDAPVEREATRFANPGYPYLLAALYRVLGAKPLVALVVQSVLGAASTFLLGLTARVLLNNRLAGLCAAIAWSLYAPAIHYDGSLLIPSITATLTIVILYSTSCALTPNQRASKIFVHATVVGLCLGASTLLRPTNALLGALIFIGPILLRDSARKVSIQFGAAVAVVALVVVVPRLVQQAEASGGFVPVSANGGMNFWVGNHAGATGIYDTAPFLANHNLGGRDYTVIGERNAYLAEARQLSGNEEMSLVESSAFWRRQAMADISAEPMSWLALEARKWLMFWNQNESRTNASLDFVSRFSPVVAFDFLGFGVLVIAGVYGLLLVLGRAEALAAALLSVAVFAPLVVCLLFFVSGEYRHPAAPALAILAGAALAHLVDENAKNAALNWVWPRRIVFGVIALCALYPVARQDQRNDFKAYAEILVSPRFDGRMPVEADYARAEALLARMGDAYADKLTRFESLLLVHSNHAIQFSSLAAATKFVETETELHRLAPHPTPEVPLSTVERIFFNLRRRVQQLAMQPFVQSNEALDHSLALLGSHDYGEVDAYVRANRNDDALRFVNEALAVAPASVDLMAHRGRLELARGDESGVQWLEKSFNGYPRKGFAAALLGEHFFRQGNLAQARMFLEQAIRREPNAPYTRALAGMLSQQD